MKLLVDPHWRRMDELFSDLSLSRLGVHDVIWGQDTQMPADAFEAALPDAEVLVAATPKVTGATLERAKKLRMVIEVSGSFPDTIDYAACAARGIEVLSCAPGFRSAVAEMGLAMALGANRGLVREHEAFRSGTEQWLEDCAETDFTLYGSRVGFVGFGQIAQETTRLLAPFRAEVRAYDPWLPADVAKGYGVTLVDLPALAAWAQTLFVTAVPTAENIGLVDADVLERMPKGSLLVILSRAHLVDFEAVTRVAASGRISVATDVFPSEPLPQSHRIRNLPNVLLSPHRAAAVKGGRHLIGEMICDDIDALAQGLHERRLAKADLSRVGQLAGVGDAAKVGTMAKKRS